MPEGGAVESNHMAPFFCLQPGRIVRVNDPGLPGCAAFTAADRVMTHLFSEFFIFVVIARRRIAPTKQSRVTCSECLALDRRAAEWRLAMTVSETGGCRKKSDLPHAPSVCGPGLPTPPPNHPKGILIGWLGRGSGKVRPPTMNYTISLSGGMF